VGDKLVFQGTIAPPADGDIRVIMRQRTEAGQVMRSVTRRNMGEFFTIDARQGDRKLPVATNHDKIVWSGLAWAAGEIPHAAFDPNTPITLTLSSQDKDTEMRIEGQVYAVGY
jgi:hypothetical protein